MVIDCIIKNITQNMANSVVKSGQIWQHKEMKVQYRIVCLAFCLQYCKVSVVYQDIIDPNEIYVVDQEIFLELYKKISENQMKGQ